MSAERFTVGDKVRYRSRDWTIVKVAKPLDFWITPGIREGDGHVVTVPAYDLIQGDDVDSFDADFAPRIQQDALRCRNT